ncbi:hypothetical protein [Radicibacter daui]|uniref:hypothetical protein n=1 Tax=Radicibacter daui TaxID=3064829 RepID=UPI004046960A
MPQGASNGFGRLFRSLSSEAALRRWLTTTSILAAGAGLAACAGPGGQSGLTTGATPDATPAKPASQPGILPEIKQDAPKTLSVEASPAATTGTAASVAMAPSAEAAATAVDIATSHADAAQAVATTTVANANRKPDASTPAATETVAAATPPDTSSKDGWNIVGKTVLVDAETAARGPANILLVHDAELLGMQLEARIAYRREMLDGLRRVLDDGTLAKPGSDRDFTVGNYAFVTREAPTTFLARLKAPEGSAAATAVASMVPQPRPATAMPEEKPAAHMAAALPAVPPAPAAANQDKPATLAEAPVAATPAVVPPAAEAEIAEAAAPAASQPDVQKPAAVVEAAPKVAAKTPAPVAAAVVPPAALVRALPAIAVTADTAPANDNDAAMPVSLRGALPTPQLDIDQADAVQGPQHIATLIADEYKSAFGKDLPVINWHWLINTETGTVYTDGNARIAARAGRHLLARSAEEFEWLKRNASQRAIAIADPEMRRVSEALEREYSPVLDAEEEEIAIRLAQRDDLWDATRLFVTGLPGKEGQLLRRVERHALILPDAKQRIYARYAVELCDRTEARPVAQRLRKTRFPDDVATAMQAIGQQAGLKLTPANYQIALQDIETDLISYADLLRLSPEVAAARLISDKGAVGPNQVIGAWMQDRKAEGMSIHFVSDVDTLRKKVEASVAEARLKASKGLSTAAAGRWLERTLIGLDDRFDRDRMSVMTTRQFVETYHALDGFGLAADSQLHFAMEAYLRGLGSAQRLARQYVGQGLQAEMDPETFLRDRRIRDGYAAKKLAHLKMMSVQDQMRETLVAEARAAGQPAVQMADAPPTVILPPQPAVQVAALPPAADDAATAASREQETLPDTAAVETAPQIILPPPVEPVEETVIIPAPTEPAPAPHAEAGTIPDGLQTVAEIVPVPVPAAAARRAAESQLRLQADILPGTNPNWQAEITLVSAVDPGNAEIMRALAHNARVSWGEALQNRREREARNRELTRLLAAMAQRLAGMPAAERARYAPQLMELVGLAQQALTATA